MTHTRQPRVGRLLAVNVGLPREVEWEGKRVRSAIWKEPVDGPRMVRKINIDGDDQADRVGHGGEHRAVFVYQIGSYRYWERKLARNDFSYGQFGENFTVEGLADDAVCIGDRYQIGEAVFEVTQPRVTCFRVGIRMNEPAMPSLLVAHHRPGFYFRVLQEGVVAPGDEIVRLLRGPEQLTVSEIDGLLYLPNRSRHDLRRALRMPALSDGWKQSFSDLLEQSEQAAPVSASGAAWAGFRQLKVIAAQRESSAIVSFRLRPPNGDPIDPALAGQYLTLRLQRGATDEPPLIRSYSLSALPDQLGGYRISVKLEPHGAGSQFLHRRIREGDLIDVAAPRGSFVLRADDRPVVLISGGVGVTPVLAMLQSLARTQSEREVWWVHGARNRAEHAFKEEVDHLLGKLPHAHRLIAYSRPGQDEVPGATFDTAGRLDGTKLDAAGIPVEADYYLCGPDGFMRGISAALTARGVPPERVVTETFGVTAAITPGIAQANRPLPHPPAGQAGNGPSVTFTRSNLTVPWNDGYASLLELAEACDVPVSYGCRAGVCHYCETGILAGDAVYTAAPLEPPGDGRILVCCAQPASEVALEL